MITVYYLEIETVDGAHRPKGWQYIHNAISQIEGTLRKVIMDTTPEEHGELSKYAVSSREATEEEKAQFNDLENWPDTSARDFYQEIDELKARVANLEKM